MIRVSIAAVFALGLVLGSLGLLVFQRLTPSAGAQTAACTNATFSGSYGVLAQSYMPGGSPSQVSAVFVATADGAGNLTLGGPNPPTGTYTVNPDCTFRVTLNTPTGFDLGSGSAPALGVLVDGGKRFYITNQDPSNPEVFLGERQ
jgi:hypothetical protein